MLFPLLSLASELEFVSASLEVLSPLYEQLYCSDKWKYIPSWEKRGTSVLPIISLSLLRTSIDVFI